MTQVPVELCSLSTPGLYLEIEKIFRIHPVEIALSILDQTAEAASTLASLVSVTSASFPELKQKHPNNVHDM